MATLTTKERFQRMYDRKEADRVPIIDVPWAGTLARWKREGMPADMDWRDFFDVDKFQNIRPDTSPRFAQELIEETDRYIITTSSWGATLKEFKAEDSTPEFLDFKVKTSDEWAKAKALMFPDRERINWAQLKSDYAKWQNDGSWISAGFWFGFDVAHSWMVGTETLLIAMIEEPEWVSDIFNTYLDMSIAHFDMIWDEGYRFDSIDWPDDMGYKNKTFFSSEMYRELLQPIHKRAVDWAHNKGIKAQLHSCGDITTLIPDIIETGVDGLNPLEVKAGMDAIALKKQFGDKLLLQGGLNTVFWDNLDQVLPEIEQKVPILKQGGGYVFSSDHSIPNSITLENYRAIVVAAKKFGAY